MPHLVRRTLALYRNDLSESLRAIANAAADCHSFKIDLDLLDPDFYEASRSYGVDLFDAGIFPQPYPCFSFEIEHALQRKAPGEIETGELGMIFYKCEDLGIGYLFCGVGNAIYTNPKHLLVHTEPDLRLSSIFDDNLVSRYFRDSEDMKVAARQFETTVAHMFALFGMLSTDGIVVDTTPAPRWLNEQRIKKGKPPILAESTLRLAVPLVRVPGWRNADGTHASPRIHWRRGHVRRLPNGKMTVVRACIVNGPGQAPSRIYNVEQKAG